MRGSETRILDQLASDEVLNSAYGWLCGRREGYHHNADVWSLRFGWHEEREEIRRDLLSGRYRFGLLKRITLRGGEEIDLWSARDALVLKALSLVLAEHLPISKRCTHLKGHGGAKAAVREVREQLSKNRFVLRTDVKSYYASIDHFLLHEKLREHIKDRRILDLLWQYMRRTSERGGEFSEFDRGISLGCPLSPIMGAFFLRELDEELEKLGLFYVRFMDDILVLSPSRWRLRRAVKVLNQVLSSLGLEKHPQKTFVGKVERSFDFLGYHFRAGGLSVATKTLEHFVSRAARLYEQEPEPSGVSRLGLYVKRWRQWVLSGLGPWGGELSAAGFGASGDTKASERKTHEAPAWPDSRFFEDRLEGAGCRAPR